MGFTLKQDQRVVWQLPPVPAGQPPLEAVRQRLRMLLGDGLPLLPVDHSAPMPADERDDDSESDSAGRTAGLRVWGFIGAPGVARGNRQDQHLFVNRRPIENRGLNYALLEGYHTALMKGRYPVCCLFLELDPAVVDVNVHPAKREVKFRHENLVRSHVGQAVRQALLQFHSGVTAPRVVTPAPVTRTEPARPPTPGPVADPVLPLAPPPPVSGQPRAPAAFKPAPQPPTAPPTASPLPTPPQTSSVASRTAGLATESSSPLLEIPLRLLGVAGKLYAVFESDRGLVLMDQHAAHERVLYEQMLERMERTGAPSQRLLLPETVELSARDADFLRQNLDPLTRLGVGLSEFGERTFLLDALPPYVKAPNAKRFVLELLDGLMESGRDVNALRLGEHTIAKTVCRHAVKAHDPLTAPELGISCAICGNARCPTPAPTAAPP